MKWLPLLAVMVCARVAAADSAGDVTSLLKKNLDAMAAKDDGAYDKTVLKEAQLYDGNGNTFALPSCMKKDDCSSGAFTALYGTYASGTAKHKLGKITVVADDANGVAWFQGPFDATFTSDVGANPCGGGPSGPTTVAMRVSGVAVKDATGWHLAAVMYTHPMSDGDLIDLATGKEVKMPAGAPAVSGDKAVGTAVTAWFPKLSGARTAGKTIVASGSAPGEFFEGDKVGKVAGAWDTLGLMPSKIDVHTFGNGKVAFVHADTAMPIKKTKFAAPLAMAAIAVPEGDGWKWVSLQFAPALSSW